MKTNRSLIVLILLTLVTFGIYPLFFWHKYSQDMNIVCAGDGKHTRGILARILFSIITLGIYDLVWMYGVGERISFNAHKKGVHCNITGGSILLWYILGAFILIGPFVALHKMLSGLNTLCDAYNANAGRGGQTINVNINTGN